MHFHLVPVLLFSPLRASGEGPVTTRGAGEGGVWVRSGTVRMHPEKLPAALEGVALNMSMDGDLQTDDATAEAAGEGEVQVCVCVCVGGDPRWCQ